MERQSFALTPLVDWHPNIAASLLAKATCGGTTMRLEMAGWATDSGLKLIFN